MRFLTDKELNERAKHKTHARLTTLDFELEDLKNDLKSGATGPITIEEHKLLITGVENEIQVWQWIEHMIYQYKNYII